MKILIIVLLLCISANAKHADEIPVAHTKRVNDTCGDTEFPKPVLSECEDSIFNGIPDLRGNWSGIDIQNNKTHWERIE